MCRWSCRRLGTYTSITRTSVTTTSPACSGRRPRSTHATCSTAIFHASTTPPACCHSCSTECASQRKKRSVLISNDRKTSSASDLINASLFLHTRLQHKELQGDRSFARTVHGALPSYNAPITPFPAASPVLRICSDSYLRLPVILNDPLSCMTFVLALQALY